MSEVKKPVNCDNDVGEGVNGAAKDLQWDGEKSCRANMLGKSSTSSDVGAGDAFEIAYTSEDQADGIIDCQEQTLYTVNAFCI